MAFTLSKIAGAIVLCSGLVIGAGGASAQTCPGVSQSQCEASCGDAGVAHCSKEGPTVNCVCNETTKDVPGNAFGTATQESSSGQGNHGNKTEEGPCTGNPGQCKQQ